MNSTSSNLKQTYYCHKRISLLDWYLKQWYVRALSTTLQMRNLLFNIQCNRAKLDWMKTIHRSILILQPFRNLRSRNTSSWQYGYHGFPSIRTKHYSVVLMQTMEAHGHGSICSRGKAHAAEGHGHALDCLISFYPLQSAYACFTLLFLHQYVSVANIELVVTIPTFTPKDCFHYFYHSWKHF